MALILTPAKIGPPDPAPQTVDTPDFPFRALASPFGTIHAATFRFSPPVGAQMPALPRLHAVAYTADSGAALSADGDDASRPEPPQIDRSLKGPRLVPRVRLDVTVPRPATGDELDATGAGFDPAGSEGIPAILTAKLWFATTLPADLTPVALAPWPGNAATPETAPMDTAPPDAPTPPPDTTPPQNKTIAPKGEVTGADQRPKSPAELLGLAGPARARHERCLANAIYFEARGEPERGQQAVAQVVINRVFSGHYPGTICGVVYQATRRHRRLRCQFSFTCDGIANRITEPDAWERATHIAGDALDGKFWLDDIGKATHYHARWVHPRWVREMRRLDRIGVHTFYRPRRWGDGSRAPVWGDAHAKL